MGEKDTGILTIAEFTIRGNRRFRLAAPRPCKECAGEFQPRRQDANAGAGLYCSPQCARVGTGKENRSTEADFWAQVGRTDNDQECWPWLGYRNDKGYGQVSFQGRRTLAHRVAYELTYGPLGAGECACHRCDNPPCCNPSDLFRGSVAVNNADMVGKGRSLVGERNVNAKLTTEIVLAVREDGRPGIEIAPAYGISRALVSLIKSRKVWAHLP